MQTEAAWAYSWEYTVLTRTMRWGHKMGHVSRKLRLLHGIKQKVSNVPFDIVPACDGLFGKWWCFFERYRNIP